MTKAGKRSALIGMAFGAGILIYFFYGRWLVLAIGLGLILVGAGIVLSRRSGRLPPTQH